MDDNQMIFQGSKNHLYDVSLINFDRRFFSLYEWIYKCKCEDMMVYRYDIQRQISQ